MSPMRKEFNYQSDIINPEYLNWIVSTSESEKDIYYTANVRALRMLYDTSYHYINPVWLPEDGELKMSKPDQKSIITTTNNLNISPNPANEYFIISYILESEPKNANLEIYDALGKKIESYPIVLTRDQKLIKCNAYAKGMYHCILRNNGQIISSSKFNIVK